MQTDTDLYANRPFNDNTQHSLGLGTKPDISADHLRVVKRNGTVVPYDQSKIIIAITKAFLAIEGRSAAASSRIHDTVEVLSQQVCDTLIKRISTGRTIHIEDIQDQVELALMRSGDHKVARSYVLYREEHSRKRSPHKDDSRPVTLQVKLSDGTMMPFKVADLSLLVHTICSDINYVDPQRILNACLGRLYDGIDKNEINNELLHSARSLIEQEPNYSYAAARLLLERQLSETTTFLQIAEQVTQADLPELYPKLFPVFISKGIELSLLSPSLKVFNLEKLGAAIKAERDHQFTYLGLQTLYDRYFVKHNTYHFELPQIFFMRVAMGLALEENNRDEKAIEFYHLLSSFDYMCASPTLFNAGTPQPQLASCFLSTVSDDLESIYGSIQDNALLSKWAGGLGNDWTQVRAFGAQINSTQSSSQGVVPFLKVVNDTAIAVNQGGKRQGTVCSYLETWHLDIETFLQLHFNNGEGHQVTHEMNTANWVPDLFMKRVFEDKHWTLFSPDEVSDLHDLYGTAFDQRYEHYEQIATAGQIRKYKRVSAKQLWRKMLDMLFATGHPWITFKDPCNLRSPQQHTGVVHCSNLCTEVTLNTSEDEIAACHLGSINLSNHIDEQGINTAKLKRSITTAVRMLDNCIDINYYPVDQARAPHLLHRSIGLGMMGFQDSLYKLGIPYSTEKAVEFADLSMETISYYALQASSLLAKERGPYGSFNGSLWSQGILPIDSIEQLRSERGEQFLELDESQTMDWDQLRDHIKDHGMRNSNVMAIAPTTTIANIVGVSQSIEPTFQNLYVKRNLSGEFTAINPYLVCDLQARGLWDNVMVNDLKYYDGSVQFIDRIPDDLKAIYATAFEIEPRWLVDAAARRQKWIDQAQSLTLYIDEPNGRKVDISYRMAWYRGLKTCYFLHTPHSRIYSSNQSSDQHYKHTQNCNPHIDSEICDNNVSQQKCNTNLSSGNEIRD